MRCAHSRADRQQVGGRLFDIFPTKKNKKAKKGAKIARQTSPPFVRVRGVFSFLMSKGWLFCSLSRFFSFCGHQNTKSDQPFATRSTRKKE
jgi:hypothetical protein